MTWLSATVTLKRGHRLRKLALLRATGALAAGLVAACGSMTVQVDVIDPAYVDTVAHKAQLQSQLLEALRPADEKIAKYDKIRADLQRGFRQMTAQAREDLERAQREGQAASAAVAQQVALELEEDTQDALREFNLLTTKLNTLDQQIRQVVAMQPVGSGGLDVTEPQLSRLLLERQATAEAGVEEIVGLLAQIDRVARGELPGAPRDLRAPTGAAPGSQILVQATVDLKSITGGFTVVESAHAYAIASADEDKWAPEFNRTFGRGTFGNLNFAIKMVSLADFTIKGVTFDPSKVAQVASKVTTQSLLLAAQIAGVPVVRPSLPQTATGGALAAESAELASILAANQRFAAQEQLRQEAIVAILTRIAEEERNLRSGDPALRDEAHRAILATYEAHKDLLRIASQ